VNLPRAAVSILKIIDHVNWRALAVPTCSTALLRSELRLLVVQPRAQRDLIENTGSKKKVQ